MLLPAVGRQQGRARIAWWSIVAILCLGIVLHLVPIYIIVITSLKSASEVLHFPPTWFPQEPTLAAWRLAVELNYRDNPVALRLLDRPLYVFFANSMFIATFTLAIGIPITSFAAYANSKLQRGAVARWSFLFFIGTLMMPTALTLIPSYLLTRNWPFALPEAPLIPGSEAAFPTVRIWDTPVGGDPANSLQRLQLPALQGLLRHHPRFDHPGGAGRWRQRIQYLPPHRPAVEHPGLRGRRVGALRFDLGRVSLAADRAAVAREDPDECRNLAPARQVPRRRHDEPGGGRGAGEADAAAHVRRALLEWADGAGLPASRCRSSSSSSSPASTS